MKRSLLLKYKKLVRTTSKNKVAAVVILLSVIFFVLLFILLSTILNNKNDESHKDRFAKVERDFAPHNFFPQFDKKIEAKENDYTISQANDLIDFSSPNNQKQGLKEKIAARSQHIKQRLEHLKNRSTLNRYSSKTINFSAKHSSLRENQTNSFSGVAETHASLPRDLTRVLTINQSIPVVLESSIKSWLPSENVRARVERDVYSHQGYNILIPRGSTIIGSYKPLEKIGDRRLAINWYRIITTDNININLLAKAEHIDGTEGATGKLDNRYMERYGAAIFFSILNAAGNLSIEVDDARQVSIAESFSNPLNEVTSQAIEQSFNIAPILEISHGTPLKVQILQDIVFKEAENNTQKIEFLKGENDA